MLELSETLRQVDRQLKTLDPMLDLHIGQIRTRQGVLVEEKLEVWRHCEDGQDRCIAWWDIADWQKILPDMKAARLGAPGHVSVLDRIDKHNLSIEKDVDRRTLAAQEELTKRLIYEYQKGRLG